MHTQATEAEGESVIKKEGGCQASERQPYLTDCSTAERTSYVFYCHIVQRVHPEVFICLACLCDVVCGNRFLTMLSRVARSVVRQPLARHISVGTAVPTAEMKFVKNGEVQDVSTDAVFKGKKVRAEILRRFTPPNAARALIAQQV